MAEFEKGQDSSPCGGMTRMECGAVRERHVRTRLCERENGCGRGLRVNTLARHRRCLLEGGG